MPAQPVSVNLLDQPELQTSSVTQLFNWAITYGRYIMIGTEIIVLLAFISRFSLDRKLTDLREEISQKRIILEANSNFEREYQQTQQIIAKAQILVSDQSKPIILKNQVIAALPQQVRLIQFKQEAKSLELEVNASTTEGFSLFLNRIQSIPRLSAIEVSEIIKDPLRGTSFKIKAKI